MELIDLDGAPRNFANYYGGSAGMKYAVVHNGFIWMLKFPESTKSFPSADNPDNTLPSHTTSPLSEYIGSHIYETLGIPAHETFLAKRDGRIAVACKDFTGTGKLADFIQLKNSFEEDLLPHGVSSRPGGDYLAEVLCVLEDLEAFGEIRGAVLERFWDMFVIDALILNNDRNNGNWGIVCTGSKPTLAPVYDNGQAFFNKKSLSSMERALSNPEAIWNDVNSSCSFYLDESGKHIKPFTYLARTRDLNCLKALKRFVNRVDMDAIDAIIDEIPETSLGVTVMPSAAKEFYRQAVHASLFRGILPAAKLQGIEIPERLKEQ